MIIDCQVPHNFALLRTTLYKSSVKFIRQPLSEIKVEVVLVLPLELTEAISSLRPWPRLFQVRLPCSHLTTLATSVGNQLN